MFELRKVTKIYKLGKVDVVAIQDIDLKVNKGDFIAVAGPSGSGKTTILNILGCLDSPTSGEAVLENCKIATLSLKEKTKIRRQKIGFIFQNFNLIPILNVYENVEYPLLLENIPSKERRQRIQAVLEEVGLRHRVKHFPNELSGGERQRVSIARALIKKPVLILADEPTANLDSVSGSNIIDLMFKLNREEQMTFVFSSHDQQVLSKAKSVIQLRDGMIVATDNQFNFQSSKVGVLG